MKRIVAVAAATVSAATLAACSPTAEESPTPTPAETTTVPVQSETPTPSEGPTPSPEPSPTPSETLDADQIAARDTVNEFFRVLNELRQDPEMELQPLADITTGQTQVTQLDSVVRFRELNLVQVGDVQLRVLSVDEASRAGDVTYVPIQVCTDSSEVEMVDRTTGEPFTPEEPVSFLNWQIEVSSENPGFWNVGDLMNEPVESCDG